MSRVAYHTPLKLFPYPKQRLVSVYSASMAPIVIVCLHHSVPKNQPKLFWWCMIDEWPIQICMNRM
jgi:hypothetical protein